MLVLAISTAVFTLLALLVLHWARTDLREREWLSTRSVFASWLLYVTHADAVGSAAWMGLLRVEVPRTPALVLGIGIGTVGFGLFLAAIVSLVRNGDLDGPHARNLVTSGPYRLARHPQNTGWALLLAGFAIGGRSLAALALVGLFAFFADRYMRYEEQHLTRSFGSEHAIYLGRTPAWPWSVRRPGGALRPDSH